MMARKIFCWPSLLASVCISSAPLHAVIVGGTLGTGNNNNTQAGLDGYLSTASITAFPYWDNLVRVGDASGVYLGYNATSMTGWVLSANHVTTPSTISVAGTGYSVLGGSTQVGSSDLKLYEIGGAPLPSLPVVPLASRNTISGDFSLMFGRGFTNSTTAPYAWATPGTNDANGMRWGTNTSLGSTLVNIGSGSQNLQRYIVVDFDGPTDPGATAYDAQAALGDSGGGLFILRSGVWELSGIAHFVDDGPNFLEIGETGDGVTNPSQYGDFTAYSDVNSQTVSIASSTGTLVPEPSATWMLASSLLLIWRRRASRG